MFWGTKFNLFILFNIFVSSEVKRGDALTKSVNCALDEMDSRSFRRLSSILTDSKAARIFSRCLLMNLVELKEKKEQTSSLDFERMLAGHCSASPSRPNN